MTEVSRNKEKYNKTVCIVGLGYIGLPTAATLAKAGFNVLGIDINNDVVTKVNQGDSHIHEPALETLIQTAVQSGKLLAKTKLEKGDKADIFIIAVPTPFNEEKKPDLSFVESAARSIATVLEPGNTVILESTCPVGTTNKINEILSEQRPDLNFPKEDIEGDYDITVAYCPERILPGKMLVEIIENDRVIGGLSVACAEKAREFYKTFVQGKCIITKARTAAMCKLAENTYRDVNIAYANELSMICEQQGIDVWELRDLANCHPRVNILQPGPGVGGHCIAVDPWFIVDTSPNYTKLIRSAREVNDSKTDYVISAVIEAVNDINIDSFVCYGLAFKPDIDDLRCSPAMTIVIELAKRFKHSIYVVEPNIDKLPCELLAYSNIQLTNFEEVISKNQSYHLALVAHKEFLSRKVDFGYINFGLDMTYRLFHER